MKETPMAYTDADAEHVVSHLATALVTELGIGLNDLSADTARAVDTAIGDVLHNVPRANLEELVSRLDEDTKRDADPDYAGSITLRAHLSHDLDIGNPMEGEHDSHFVWIEDVDLLDLQIRDRWKDIAVWTARDGLLGEGDHNLIADAEKFIGALETQQDGLDEEAAAAAAKGPFAIIEPLLGGSNEA
jgi:hypothetical protein